MRVASRIVEELSNVRELPAVARTIYIAALMQQPESLRALATAAGVRPDTVRKYCHVLECLGWMRLPVSNTRVRSEALVPPEIEAKLASEFSAIVALSPYKGEETTMLFLEWVLAPTVRLIYHARPDFLRNPGTGQNLEYDVFAPDYSWAVEYQGDQHFGPTALYQGEREFIERHRRDLLKARLSRQNNVRLSFVTKDDLTLQSILQIIPPAVPRRAIDERGPVVQALEKQGMEIAGRQDPDRE